MPIKLLALLEMIEISHILSYYTETEPLAQNCYS